MSIGDPEGWETYIPLPTKHQINLKIALDAAESLNLTDSWGTTPLGVQREKADNAARLLAEAEEEIAELRAASGKASKALRTISTTLHDLAKDQTITLDVDDVAVIAKSVDIAIKRLTE